MRAACRAGVASAMRRAASTAPAPPVLVASVYISEGRNAALIAALARAAGAPCLRVFADAPYNRTGFTLASASPPLLEAAALRLASAALASLDLRAHDSSHPRLGVVDHVAVHALGSASDAQRRSLASASATRIGASFASQLSLPVWLYGWASDRGAQLDAVRRALGYFAPHQPHGQPPPVVAPLRPDMGPEVVDPAAGVACVGAVPWVVNYNILLRSAAGGDADDAALMAAARRVAGVASARRGGLPSVQALALRHAAGVEVACNLLDPLVTTPATVLAAVTVRAQKEGLSVVAAYETGMDAEQLLQMARAAGGRGDEHAAAAG